MAFLQINGLKKSFGSVEVLKGIDLSLEKGQVLSIIGPSGSGKTTLLNMISGMDTYEEGELYIEGEPTSHYDQPEWENYRKKYISFIFQEYNIIDSFTVLQNVELALSYIDSPKERRARALELIERVGLTKFKNHKGSKLSGGQKQRAAVARALITNPKLILADEPTGALDSKATDELLRLFAKINEEGQTILMVTHSVKAASHAGRVLFIKDGEVFHQIYRGKDTNEQFYQKISDALILLATGGEN